jgi:hypothetical protein
MARHEVGAARSPGDGSRPRRLIALMAAGLVDSLFLSLAWTVVVLEVTAAHGLVAAGLCSTAMLIGVALSAPTAGWLSRRLDGRRLLRSAAGVEAVLRVCLFALLLAHAGVWTLAVCVTALNVMAWTGYAGMRAEVAAVSSGAIGLTWYGTVVASVEAAGVALAALLPASGPSGRQLTLLAVATVYVLALLPTVVVAGGSQVPRGAAVEHARRRTPRISPSACSGVALMFIASAPALLAVALAAQLHGRASVGFAAVSFTLGSLASPLLSAHVQRAGRNRPLTWVLCAAGMAAGWSLAPYSVALMCVAQVASGLCMTSLEGLLDADAAHRRPQQVTAALAEATAGRALGSAGGTAVLPIVVASVGVTQGVGAITGLLVVTALLLVGWQAVGRRRAVRAVPPGPDAPQGAPAPSLSRV